MKVLVTGGAGYIGSHTVYDLVAYGAEVVVVDNLTKGHREALHPKAAFYEGDIRDIPFLDGIFQKEKIDAVVHFAACSLVGESMEDPLKYFDNNVNGTRCLLASMLNNGVEKIVFSSTAAVYGEPEHLPIVEGDRTAPTNVYGETKLQMERMFHWTDVTRGVKYVSLRYFNACGAREGGSIGEDHMPETHLIPLVLQVANGRRDHIDIYGDDYDTPDGTCLRDYIHVADLSKAHILALEHLIKGSESTVCNLGNGEGFSVKEIIEATREATGHPIPAQVKPRRAGDPARLIASSQKARELLNWQPEYTDIQRIIETAWQWHKSHPDGYGK